MPLNPASLCSTLAAAIACLTVAAAPSARAESPVATALANVQPAMVKVYGAGGFRGLEAYQSGFLISADGHIVTAYSTVLDTSMLRVVLADGRRLDARLLGADPRLDVALLEVEGEDLPFLDLKQAVEAPAGTRVLAFSNMFGVATGNEPVTVQHGVISIITNLEARRGTFDTPYSGRVYVLDAVTNNPGAAGGALVTRDGRLLAMLGKELRNRRNNTWINYALPISELRSSIEAILSGESVVAGNEDDRPKALEPLTAQLLGVILVPDVVPRTPPYIDAVRPDSPAAAAGLLPDDLIVFLDDALVPSCKAFVEELEYRDRLETVQLSVLRGSQLIQVELTTEQGGRP